MASRWVLIRVFLQWGALAAALLPASARAAQPPGGFALVRPRLVSAAELQQLRVQVRPERLAQRPRVLFSRDEVKGGWRPYGAYGKDVRQHAAALTARLRREPPNPAGPGFELPLEAAGVYWAVEDPALARAITDWMLATASLPKWDRERERAWRTEHDLSAGYLLTALSIGYDTLYDVLSDSERRRIREKLVVQARIVADHHRISPDTRRAFPYEQNHYFIPVTGLGLAAFALYGEVPEAREWADLCRRFMDRHMASYSADGYFFEGAGYATWVFPFVARYLRALERMAGETLLCDELSQVKYYAAHLWLPPAKAGECRSSAFFFADCGPIFALLEGRMTHYHDYPVHPNMEALVFLAPRFNDPLMLGVARHYRPEHWRDVPIESLAGLQAAPIDGMPPYHYFSDHEVVTWRTSWGPGALCAAFRCGPPEGHRFWQRYQAIEDASFNFTHAHPDANSLQVDAGGELLACGPGYVGIKLAANENTLLVDGRGQRNDGQPQMWRRRAGVPAVPYADYDQLRMEAVHLARLGAYACGQAAPVYYADLEMRSVRRHLFATAGVGDSPGHVLVFDELDSALPHTYTFLLHTVRDMEPLGARSWLARGREMGLRIDALGAGEFVGEVAPTVVAPQKGEATRPFQGDKARDHRATHVAIRNAAPAPRWEFLTSLLPWRLDALRAAPSAEPILEDGVRGVRLRHPDGLIETKLVALGQAWRVDGFLGRSRAASWAVAGNRMERLLLLGGRAFSSPHGGGLEVRADADIELGLARPPGSAWGGEILVRQPATVFLAAEGETLLIPSGAEEARGRFRLAPGLHLIRSSRSP